jgi:hypothetical protein
VVKTEAWKRKERNEQSESGTCSETPQYKQNKYKLRIYSDRYLKMGFTWTGSEDFQIPLVMKMDLREIRFGDVDWIHWAQDRDRWRTLVNTVMNLRVL